MTRIKYYIYYAVCRLESFWVTISGKCQGISVAEVYITTGNCNNNMIYYKL